MKRDAIALVVQPYKNPLVPRVELKNYIDLFVTSLCDLIIKHPSLRLNLVLSGVHLELLDPHLSLKLRDLVKNWRLEILSPGYTEVFASFSSRWIFSENLTLGQTIFLEKLGTKPSGYAAPFSNWEPSYLDIITTSGFSYVTLSRSLFPPRTRTACGYWSTEHAGSSLFIVPQIVIPAMHVPIDLLTELETALASDQSSIPPGIAQCLCISYLTPLLLQTETSLAWLAAAATALELNALAYQTICMSEYFGMTSPLSLQYIPPSLFTKREDVRTVPYFLNYLHTYDQIGIMQRKMIELTEQCTALPESAFKSGIKKQLCQLHDINRYLPHKERGFIEPSDRHACFSQMIAIEKALYESIHPKGGQIRIADFMRNGTKCIIMENRSCKAYLDHKNGGQLFALDYRHRTVNVAAAYSGQRHDLPAITAAGISKTMFIDHMLDSLANHAEFVSGENSERGDFVANPFSYTVKKTPEGVKLLLSRNGSVLVSDKTLPVFMEKVFGLDGDGAVMSFAYKLSTHSLMPIEFLLAIELNFFVPGALYNKAFFAEGRAHKTDLSKACIQSHSCTKFALEDHVFGYTIGIHSQKPVTVWCYPLGHTKQEQYQGTAVVLTTLVHLDATTPFSLPGKIKIRKTRRLEKIPDAI